MNIAVISHDAGGATILSSYVGRNPDQYIYVLDGPAINIFSARLGEQELTTLANGIKQADEILCGTSWASDLELNAIALAKEARKKAIVFLDHWVQYRQRFTRGDAVIMPDEIWVGDSYAYQLAKDHFAGVVGEIKHVPNPYFEDITRQFKKLRKKNIQQTSTQAKTVLYVCEPMRDFGKAFYQDEQYYGYNEEDALNYFLMNISRLDADIDRIIIRPHPAEKKDKYNWVLDLCDDIKVEIGGTMSLLLEIERSDMVVGCESMAMVVGLLAGKTVVTSVPPGGRPCALPYKSILSLQSLV